PINDPPSLQPIGNRQANENHTLTIQLLATDPENDTLTFGTNAGEVLPSAFSFSPATGLFAWTPTFQDSGSYNITFNASDGGLSDEETITITVLNVNRPPSLQPIGNRQANENDTLAIQLLATDPDNDTLTFGTNAGAVLPSPPSFDPQTGLFQWTPTFSDAGNYSVTFNVTDGEAGDEEAITVTVSNVNRQPVIITAPPRNAFPGQTYAYDVGAADPDNDPLAYSLLEAPVNMTINPSTGLIQWAPPFCSDPPIGNRRPLTCRVNVSVRASDGFLGDTQNYTLEVTAAQKGAREKFSTPRRVTANDADSTYPSLAVDAQGNLHAVWTDTRDGNAEIYYKKLDPEGRNLTPDIRVTEDPGISYDPAIVFAGENLHGVWTDDRNGNAEIYYKRLNTSGNNLTWDIRLTRDGGESFYPALAAGPSVLHVAWTDDRDNDTEIYHLALYANGSASPARRVTSSPGFSLLPAVAADGSDNAHIAWTDDRDGNAEIYYTKLDSGGSPLVGETRVTSAGEDSSFPSLVADSQGNAHLVWSDGRDGNHEIYYHKLDANGSTAVGDTRITNSSGSSWFPSLAFGTGKLRLAWSERLEWNDEIYYTSLTVNGVAGEKTRLTNDPADSSLPVAAARGNITHIVWEESRDGNREIYHIRSL
ncbi:MAG: BNR-4 repeat-containing protein, partial [Candidatus Aenigmarchaeota archaeon]|nr:BNR-4 repeat-containing protein [Candidatus Aenigmarchaeota archaeon]